jgi:adenylate cyclase
VEIERTYLLDDLPPDLDDHPSTHIRQGYLAVADGVEVRIRARDGDFMLTVKGGNGLVRSETTITISEHEFDELWSLTVGRRVEKRRWVIPHGELEVEVDVFAGKLSGLALVEVEFDSEVASTEFAPPDWFGREVTDEVAYGNAQLAVRDAPPTQTLNLRSR